MTDLTFARHTRLPTPELERRTHSAAFQLMALPLLVALAGLAHELHVITSAGFGGAVVGSLLIGAIGARRIAGCTRRRPVLFDTNPDHGKPAVASLTLH